VAARQVLVTVDRVVPAGALADTPQTVGHIVNYATHAWYQCVIRGMQDRADELGITLEVKDANLDIARQIAAAEDFMAQGVDVRIIIPVNEEGVVELLRRATEEGMPVVPEGNPVHGMTTMVAICDHDTGYHAGVAAGEYARDNLGGVARAMNVGLPLLSATVLRSMGFMDGLRRFIPDATLVHDRTAAATRTGASRWPRPRSRRMPTSTSSSASTTARPWAACRPGRRRAGRGRNIPRRA
jgi:ABC-type sugar transport system substrate-binding protein